ncbi:UNVERIFIED_CONTAM: hypothetical protein GTU68_033768 [Idotea baltica]|nr:hypothetical protein [Idotea baltica]
MDTSTLSESLVESGDEEEAMTASDVLHKLEELWITEKMSPTLQPHHGELVDCMLDQLSQMTENLKRCKKNDFRLAIHKLEIDRIRYIISSYLRTRLQKIERFAHHLLDIDSSRTENKPSVLSPDEHKYAKEYVSNFSMLMTTLASQHMPENLQSFEKATLSVKPNLDSYVFFKVKKEVKNLLIEDNTGEGRDEEVDLELEQQHLMRYSSVYHLLDDGSINLI